jgi:hypothetical protein
MSRPHAGILAGFLVAVLAAEAALAWARGGVYVDGHEGDTIHLIEIVLRMAAGEWPHLDFLTPLGVLAFAPIVLFVSLGLGVGHAILAAQVLVGAVLLPAAWWVGVSRLGRVLAHVLGAMVIVLATAVVHGETVEGVSVSMHYNRWAWAVAFVVVPVAVLAPGARRSAWADGAILGLGMAALALTKMTFFAALIGPVVLALALRRDWRALAVALGAGLAVVAATTAVAGMQFWAAYLGDLVTVSGSGIRPDTGRPLARIATGAAYLPANLLLLAGVMLLRQARRADEGLVLLVLAPAFVFITYQNWGNDPQWLPLLGVLLLALRPAAGVRNGFGWDLRQALGWAGMAAFLLGASSLLNVALSPWRHLGKDAAQFTPMIGLAAHQDIASPSQRTWLVNGAREIALPGLRPDLPGPLPEERQEVRLGTEDLAWCELKSGVVGWFRAVAADLSASGLAEGRTVLLADTFSPLWMYGAGRPLPGGEPWYYGGGTALARADLLLVPACPTSARTRRMLLADLAAREDLSYRELRRSELYILLERQP